MAESDYPYLWTWRQRTYDRSAYGAGEGKDKVAWFGDGVDRAGQRCRVLARGAMNSALIEFEDGYQVLTSRGGLKKATMTIQPAAPSEHAGAQGAQLADNLTRHGRTPQPASDLGPESV